MKSALKTILAAAVFTVFACHAYAQQSAAPASPVVKNQVCAAERQNVVANCKNGDPCGTACRQAHQQMKACRVANNLPKSQHVGGHMNAHPCGKNTLQVAPAPGAAPPSGAVPAH